TTNIVVDTSLGSTVRVTVTPGVNQSGSTVLAFRISDDVTAVSTNVTLNVAFTDFPPTISSIGNKAVAAGGTTTNISFTVSDVEGSPRSLTVTAHSSDQSLVPGSLILLGGADANRTIQLTSLSQPTTVNLPKSATISVIVTDSSHNAATNIFQLRVDKSPVTTVGNNSLITIRDNTTATPYPSQINVNSVFQSVVS